MDNKSGKTGTGLPVGPDTIPTPLLQALEVQDFQAFAGFCQQHQAAILQNFRSWTRVPESIRSNPQAANRWAQAVIEIAQYFNSQGYSELMDIIAGNTTDNPLVRWQDGMMEADRLHTAGQYAQSNAILINILDEMKGASGGFIDSYRPKIYNLLGSNYFYMESTEMAQRYTELALQECQRVGDEQGAGIYRENLRSILAASATAGQVTKVRADIASAQDLSDRLNYGASNRLLHTLLESPGENSIEEYHPKILGLLGSNYYHMGEIEKAKEYTRQAIEASQRSQDMAGVSIYRANLNFISKE